ncbi:MAG: 50S ribosomal protein L13 [Saprospiraceae bacterium]|nr:50S ribosomal protein L13 [Saprospiraceae bacterium]MBP7644764.1 50S ribosomal protein L13 [Saprospiraceae bacterium]HMS70345.1 50S ribosomal protein L13 [Saprospiraceae bacterium]HPN71655.1 50S ribosomal protein L13 [Saprospiraceae bacterium]
MNTLSYKTVSAKKETVERSWFVVDAEDLTVGRLSSKIATTLMGKHKPSFTSHVDTGDYVIVINAEKVKFTGNKWADKEYQRYSGYPGGQVRTAAIEVLAKKPTAILERSVRGMLPKTKLGDAMYRKLFVYEGPEHPHAAQQPQPFKL